MNIIVTYKGEPLLNFSGFKQENEGGWDPSIVLKMPEGNHVTFMFGNKV
jgi:hypothetical protein